jgi:hypothetical protein
MVGRRSIVNSGAVLAVVVMVDDIGDREVLSNPAAPTKILTWVEEHANFELIITSNMLDLCAMDVLMY